MEQAKQPKTDKPRKSYYGACAAEPKCYNRLDLWEGTTISSSGRKLRTYHRDEYAGATWDELAKQLREQYGNVPLHIRAYGGPEKVGWYIPPTYKWAEKKDTGIAIESIEALAQDSFTAKEEILKLRRENADLRKLTDELARGAGRKVRPVIVEEEEEEEEPEKLSPLEAFLEDVLKVGGPALRDGLLGMLGLPVNNQNQQRQPMAPQPNFSDPSQANKPMPEQPEEFLTCPEEIEEFFESIDYERTDWRGLLAKLQQYASLLGIVFKNQ